MCFFCLFFYWKGAWKYNLGSRGGGAQRKKGWETLPYSMIKNHFPSQAFFINWEMFRVLYKISRYILIAYRSLCFEVKNPRTVEVRFRFRGLGVASDKLPRPRFGLAGVPTSLLIRLPVLPGIGAYEHSGQV